jgi:hypothetical protein
MAWRKTAQGLLATFAAALATVATWWQRWLLLVLLRPRQPAAPRHQGHARERVLPRPPQSARTSMRCRLAGPVLGSLRCRTPLRTFASIPVGSTASDSVAAGDLSPSFRRPGIASREALEHDRPQLVRLLQHAYGDTPKHPGAQVGRRMHPRSGRVAPAGRSPSHESTPSRALP